jgi:hypothetical protein
MDKLQRPIFQTFFLLQAHVFYAAQHIPTRRREQQTAHNNTRLLGDRLILATLILHPHSFLVGIHFE